MVPSEHETHDWGPEAAEASVIEQRVGDRANKKAALEENCARRARQNVVALHN